MPHFKSINFYPNKFKIELFLQNKNFRVLMALPPDPQWPPAELPNSRTQSPSPLQISCYAPDTRRVLLILPSFRILQLDVIELAK